MPEPGGSRSTAYVARTTQFEDGAASIFAVELLVDEVDRKLTSLLEHLRLELLPATEEFLIMMVVAMIAIQRTDSYTAAWISLGRLKNYPH